MNGEGKPDRSASLPGLSSQYAANSELDAPWSGDLADDAVRVELPDEPPPLTPEAARALLRLLLSIRSQRTN